MPAAGEVVEQLAGFQLSDDLSAGEVVHHRRELPEVAEQQEVDLAVHGEAGDVAPEPGVEHRDLLHDEPVHVAVPVPDAAPHPVVGRLRLRAAVLHGGVGLRDDLDPEPLLPEAGHDLAGQVSLAGAGVAGQQQALALEAGSSASFQLDGLLTGSASMHGFRYWPSRALTSSHRYTGVPSVLLADEAVQQGLVFLGQVLEDHAVGFDGLEVLGRHRRQGVPDPGDRDVLRGHDEVVNRPAALVGQQLRDVDVVPVHPPCGVHKELPVLAPGAVVLVVAGAHRVDQVHVARRGR